MGLKKELMGLSFAWSSRGCGVMGCGCHPGEASTSDSRPRKIGWLGGEWALAQTANDSVDAPAIPAHLQVSGKF